MYGIHTHICKHTEKDDFFTYLFSDFELVVCVGCLGNWGSLDVVWLEVALEVEDLEFILLGDLEEFAEGSIGLDVLLLHEAVLLGVVADSGGDLAAAGEAALGLAEEDTEFLRDNAWLGEDGLLLWLLSAIGIEFWSLAVAATLAGLLEFAWDALLQLLHLREDLGEGAAHLVHLLNEAVEFGDDVDFFLLLLNNGWGSGGNNWGHSGSHNNWGWGWGWGCDGGNWGGDSGLLGVLLGGGLALGSLCGGAHLMSGP